MKILIVEDEEAYRMAMVSHLTSHGFHCEFASRFKDALDKIELHEYDCILLDLNLPGGNGFQLIERLRAQKSQAGVIIISSQGTIEDKIRGLTSGSDDYLAKPFSLEELEARVRALIRRRSFAGNEVITFEEISIEPEAGKVKIKDREIELTRKEFDLLLFFISHRDRLLSREAIAENISGDDAADIGNMDFVYTHIKNLRKKIEEAGGKDYFKTVYGKGYKFSIE